MGEARERVPFVILDNTKKEPGINTQPLAVCV
jgi:hypothetical protein